MKIGIQRSIELRINLKLWLVSPLAALVAVLLWDNGAFSRLWMLVNQVAYSDYKVAGLAILTVPTVSILAVLIFPLLGPGRHFKRNRYRSQINLTRQQLCIIQARVQQFYERNGRLPDQLREVGLTPTMLINPWGKRYFYYSTGQAFMVRTELPEALYGEPNPAGQPIPRKVFGPPMAP